MMHISYTYASWTQFCIFPLAEVVTCGFGRGVVMLYLLQQDFNSWPHSASSTYFALSHLVLNEDVGVGMILPVVDVGVRVRSAPISLTLPYLLEFWSP